MRWSLFCRVVDNFGDIGVCWRLARQLQQEYGQNVTLWVDDLAALARIAPTAAPLEANQTLDGVQVRHWSVNAHPADDADVVIEAFACEIPASMLAAMRTRATAPLWLNLEYLSAEDWVTGCHALASPQGGGLNKYFFFPGFVAGTGGVIGEEQARQARARWSVQEREALLTALGVANPTALTLSLFAYENPALAALIQQIAATQEPVNLLVPEGRVLPELAKTLDLPALQAGQQHQLGALNIHILPMVAQADYDRLLWSCDLNFVRGEDSFVRAQWAARPLVWHIYPQDDAAHEAKLAAFLKLYTAGWDEYRASRLAAFWFGWNRGELAAGAWADLREMLPQAQQYAAAWATHLESLGNLAANLVSFAKDKLK
ncbi:elongation factor P maturation arginine rhamnosyltransferase EarP [Silvimonas sp.]|uniref:elongation factor P maturation arginine rhamnosyltransferase EarP n=1 Tax=Silvimonas sp. TaxID=2650811 RepID=UPI00283B5588|nr:elongation factor P maturation arginine rhamnosyltransferase EarP [Silvimonas sp.]MDR3427045.1 elongation factor P maturation arginine rhamnosyltransferase EarP [Silvimonas sp.]